MNISAIIHFTACSLVFDGMIGTIYLFIGFIFQVLGYAGIEGDIAITSAYALLLISLAIYFGDYRIRKANEWESAISEMDEEESEED